jgi:tensin
MQSGKANSKTDRPRDLHLTEVEKFERDENINITFNSYKSHSDDDNSPEMNCKKVIDKPTLVKRLTMGLLRLNDQESRPLGKCIESVMNSLGIKTQKPIYLFMLVTNRSSPNSPSRRNYFYHYINAGIYDVDNKFGDSCRQSLTSVVLDADYCDAGNRNTIEFDFKKNIIRETSSANCSPKKFLLSSSLKRTDSLNANHHIDDDIEDIELKEASWFHTGLPRELSLEVLAQQSPGDFIVRRTNNKNGSFTLSVRIPGTSPKIAHYLIVRTSRGYKIKVSTTKLLTFFFE